MIEPKILKNVSASQVDTYKRCPRLWFFQKIVGVKVPQSAAMAKGEVIHSLIEKYLSTGELPPPESEWHKLVVAASAVLPREDGLLVEIDFTLDTFEGGPPWIGFIDTLYAGRNPPWVNDHKTISDFRYCKTPEEIRENGQLLSYAKHVLTVDDEFDGVDIGHTYLRTRGAAKVLQPDPVFVERAHVEDRWAGMVDVVREMDALAQAPPQTALEVTPHTDACGAYGGCYFRSECGIIPSLFQISTKKKENTVSTLAEKLAAKRAAQQVVAPTVAQATVAQAPVAAPPAPVAQTTAPPATPTQTVCPKCRGKKVLKEGADSGWLLCKQCGGSGSIGAAILSPDAPPRTDPPAASEAAPTAEVAKIKKPRKIKGSPAPTPVDGPQIVIKVEDENGAMREIDPGAPAAPPPAPQTKAAAIAETSAKLNAELAKKREASPRKVPATAPTIYIDCVPLKNGGVHPTPFEDWLAPIQELVAEENGVPDYGLISYTSRGVLMAAIQQCLDTLPEVLFVKSSYRGAEVFLEAVVPHAKNVIQGLR